MRSVATATRSGRPPLPVQARTASKCVANCSPTNADAAPDALRELGEQIRALGLWAVFSTPATLFAADGALDRDALDSPSTKRAALGARIVKLQLGGTPDGTATDAATLDRALTAISTSRARVVVENGQLRAGGTIDAFAALFDALAEAIATRSR